MCAGLPVVLAHQTHRKARGPRLPPPTYRPGLGQTGNGTVEGPTFCPVGSLTAGTFPLSVPCLLSGMWKCLSSCLLWAPCCPPHPAPCGPQVLAAALTSHRVHVVRAGPGSRGVEWWAWGGAGQQVGAPGRHACTPASVHAPNPAPPERDSEGRPPPTPHLPCCLCVLK